MNAIYYECVNEKKIFKKSGGGINLFRTDIYTHRSIWKITFYPFLTF
jgi:hypothetical protein